MVVLPLVVSALALGVVEIGDVRRLGRMGLRTLVLTAILSLTAVALGIALVNFIRPGHGLAEEKREQLNQRFSTVATATVEKAQKAKPLSQTLLDIIPENPLQEMAGAVDGSSKGNGMLAVMFFALIFGVAITVVPTNAPALVGCLEGAVRRRRWSSSASRCGSRPLASPASSSRVTAQLGFDILTTLGWFVAHRAGGPGLHLFGRLFARRCGDSARMKSAGVLPRSLAKPCSPRSARRSSNATLPTATPRRRGRT